MNLFVSNLTSDGITLYEAALLLYEVAFNLATIQNVIPILTALRASPLPPFKFTSITLCGTYLWHLKEKEYHPSRSQRWYKSKAYGSAPTSYIYSYHPFYVRNAYQYLFQAYSINESLKLPLYVKNQYI